MPRSHTTTSDGCALETRPLPGILGVVGLTAWWCVTHDDWWYGCPTGDGDDVPIVARVT
jgi:hypothetical protein